MLRDVRSHQRGVRLIEVSIDVSAASGATLSKTGITRGYEQVLITDDGGDVYTLTLANPCSRPCLAFVQTTEAAGTSVYVSGKTNLTVELSGLVTDADVLIVAFDSEDET